MDRASLFTDHRTSGLPIRPKYEHFRTIWEHTCDNSPTDFISSSLKWWSSMHGVDTLYSCWVVLFADSQYRSTHFFAWPLHIIRPWRNTKILRVWKLFYSSPLKFSMRTWFCNCPQYLCSFHIVFESRKDVGSPKSTSLLRSFHIGSLFCFFFQPILCHPHTQIRKILFDGVRLDIPNLELSPNRVLTRFSQITFPIIVLPKDDPTDFAQQERLGLPCWTMILAICVVGKTNPNVWTFRFGNFQ